MAKRSNGVFDMDELAEFIGVPVYMDVWEAAADYLGEARYYAGQEAREEGLSEEEAEEEGHKAEEEAEKDVYFKYTSAVEAAVDHVLAPHNLAAEDVGKGQYKIVPVGTWKDAAWELVRTINGVGMFEFEDAKEFKDSGPYKSYKEAVLVHLPWTKYYPEVYGVRSAERVYEAYWR